MIIQGYPNELDWVNAKLAEAGPDCKSFVTTFCRAALRADSDNYELLRLPLGVLMVKYPAQPKRLAAERTDRDAVRVRIERGAMDRFIITHPQTGTAWTGSRWAAHRRGLSPEVQICNFESEFQARECAKENGFEVAP